jgi:hypothetical protein
MDPWLCWWFEHGAPGTVTVLALQTKHEPSSPVTLQTPPQDRMDELLRSVDTLYLCGAGVHWDSLTFRDLTTLHLVSLYDLPAHYLAQILSASPRIQCLQLVEIGLSDYEAIVLQPIHLNNLEILELSWLSSEYVVFLLNMILPGSCQLTLSFNTGWTLDNTTKSTMANALVSFCRLAKVTKFCVKGAVFPQDLTAMSDLEVLVLKSVDVDESLCDLIAPRSAVGLPPLPTPLCKLHTVKTTGSCNITDMGGFKRVLAACPIRTIRTGVPGVLELWDEGVEGWAARVIDCKLEYQEDLEGYSPFGGYYGSW